MNRVGRKPPIDGMLEGARVRSALKRKLAETKLVVACLEHDRFASRCTALCWVVRSFDRNPRAIGREANERADDRD